MKNSELRIGNLVMPLPNKSHYGDKLIKVESVYEDGININFREYKMADLQPIPLTEEWLIKFGFVKNNDSWEDEEVTLIKQGEDNFYITNGGIELISSLPIDYVHQFQNLYFAITGEELSVINP